MILDKFAQIDTFLLDVDGVLTDGCVTVLTNGDMLRKMNVKDGYALKTAIDAGFNICIISGGSNEGVRLRLKGLGITDIYLGAHNKIEQLNDYFEKKQIKSENVLYMGDDIPDLCAMQHVGVAACPNDASSEVKKVSDFISKKNGGEGCVRDIIELIMRAQGNWYDQENNPSNYADFAW